jgi:hypothetical protein
VASPVFDEPEQGRAGGLRLLISRTSPSTQRRPRRALKEAGGGIETTRTTGPVLAVTKRAGALSRRIGGLPDAGEKTRTRRSDHRPGKVKKRARLLHRSWVWE